MGRPWVVTRERRLEAACACDQMASSNDAQGIGPSSEISNNVHGKAPMIALAAAAFNAVYDQIGMYETVREAWAEAGQLLRDGWSPGDTVITMEEVREREIDAKSKAMDAAGVPADAETVAFTETEGRTIDTGEADLLDDNDLAETEAMIAAEEKLYEQCENPECPALEHPEDLHCHGKAKQLADEMRDGTASFNHDAANDEPTTFEDEKPADDGSELINY